MDISNFKWQNQSSFSQKDGAILLEALPKTDYFINPVDGLITANAAYLYDEIEGDFVMRAKIEPHFVSAYDAGVLFVMISETQSVKACFEKTDFNTRAVVTVITNGFSDDANGVNLDSDCVYLQITRKENVYAVHYSLNGEQYFMARLCAMPKTKKVKAGLVAQSPTGEGGVVKFYDFCIEKKTVENIRFGR